jgi:hypothetical protein
MMRQKIRLHSAIAHTQGERLHLKAGRALGEREFDQLQAYVDYRCDALLCAQTPGIVQGLEVSVTGLQEDQGFDIETTKIRVFSGRAVGTDARAIRLFHPLDITWPDLLSSASTISSSDLETNDDVLTDNIADGFYYLCLSRAVMLVDEGGDLTPCTRHEQDMLRDSRVETITQLHLEPIEGLELALSDDRLKASNYLLANQLSQSSNQPIGNDLHDKGAIRIALLKITNNQLQWLDNLAGRYLSEQDSAYQCFSRHWEHHIARGSYHAEGSDNADGSNNAQGSVNADDSSNADGSDNPANINSSRTLSDILGMRYMPSAGTFPSSLITQLAGESISSQDGEYWQRPTLGFSPRDLEIELVPIAISNVQGALARESNRSEIDLAGYKHHRVRLMVAVDDKEYRPDLMALAQANQPLLQTLETRYAKSISDYNAWANQFDQLYKGLDRDLDQPSSVKYFREPIALFSGIYQVAGPIGVYPKLAQYLQADNLKIPPFEIAPVNTSVCLSQLAEQRSKQLADNQSLPRPYQQHQSISQNIEPVAITVQRDAEQTAGLYRERADIEAEILALEQSLEESFDLIDEVNDFILLQRQHLDSISVSFASLAGGVPGDGSGLNLMRWSGNMKFEYTDNTAQTENSE